MKTLKEILSLAIQFLETHKVPRNRLVAESLLAHFLGMKRIELYMHHDRPLVENELAMFRVGLKRAKAGEPIEYITGSLSFFDCHISVNQNVLIPRQETELLLDLAIKRLQGNEKRALDLCTGSGCLAIGLKKARPDLEVVAVDLSAAALQVARKNGEANGVSVQWLEGDLTAPLQQKFDLILCNPPYIAASEFEGLDAGVRDFEPKMALVSGETGYEIYERLKVALPPILNEGAQVFFEIGSLQGEGVKKRFAGEMWSEMEVLPDWAGHDRFFFLKM